MKRFIFAAALALCAAPLLATPAEDAAAAASALRTATTNLKAANDRSDRMAALSETIFAIEGGMAALRGNMREVAVQEATIQRRLSARQDEIATLFETLLLIERSPEPTLLLHPMGPMGTARSAMLMSGLTPGITEQVDRLRLDLEDLKSLKFLQTDAQDIMGNALQAVQLARIDLAQAISDRTETPRRFVEDPTKTALLLATTETLDSFAQGLGEIPLEEEVAIAIDPANLFGELPLPVVGRLLRKFNELDAAGIQRPGMVFVTEPGALVTSPAAATVRYQGPLLDYGQVVILEPAQNLLLVFAGLGQIFAQTGEVVNKGAPIGLMSDSIGGSALAQDTIYIEVREAQTPVDPTEWFKAE